MPYLIYKKDSLLTYSGVLTIVIIIIIIIIITLIWRETRKNEGR